MRVTELRLCDFRNLGQVHLTPSPRFNIFEGRNGAGKTNLLEAIYVLGALKSFRPGVNADLVRWGSSQAEIQGVVEQSPGITRVVRVLIGPKGRRVRIDGKAVRSLQSSLGQLTVVVFAPEDLAITKGSPSGRRRFLDRAIFNRWPASLADQKRYETAVKQRNALLRDDGPDAMLDVFDAQLAQSAAAVLRWRLQYLAEYRSLVTDCLTELSGGELEGTVAYRSDQRAPEADAFVEVYARSRRRDRARRTTSVGPHTDDLDCLLGGRPARSFASQGQHRAFVLALKIAEIRLLQKGLGHSPVLLLDDVSSELDEQRNAQLMSYLASDAFGGQVFLSTTEKQQQWLSIDSQASCCFTIRSGEVV